MRARDALSVELHLRIELVPKPLHSHNLRSDAVGIGKSRWTKLRKTLLAERGPGCAICGSAEGAHAHEVWEYEEKRKLGVARLVGIEVVCARCHHVHHWGFTKSLATEGAMEGASMDALIEHFENVNGCSRKDFELHESESFVEWKRRNRLKWRIDWGDFAKLVKEARKGRPTALKKPVNLKVPCANCSKPIILTFPVVHTKSRKRLGLIYVCNSCGRGGRMELPPGTMGVLITKGARTLFSADVESAAWKAEVGGTPPRKGNETKLLS